MNRLVLIAALAALIPAGASAQQTCTTDTAADIYVRLAAPAANPAAPVTGYRIRLASAGQPDIVRELDPADAIGATGALVLDVPLGRTYTATATAYGPGGESIASNALQLTIVPKCVPPAPPTLREIATELDDAADSMRRQADRLSDLADALRDQE